MKSYKSFLFTLIPTFLFFIFFEGLNLLFRIKFAPPEETYYFTGGETPSDSDILLMGFKNISLIVYHLLISIIFTIGMISFVRKLNIIANYTFYIITPIISTLLIGTLYTIYKLFYASGYDNSYLGFYLEDIKWEIVCLMNLYLITIAIPMTIIIRKNSRN